MGVVHQSSGHLTPLSQHLLSKPAIIARLAKATLTETKVNWTALVENYDHIRDSIEAVILGFGNYNQRVRKKGGFYLPNNARATISLPPQQGRRTLHAIKSLTWYLKDNEFMMMTIDLTTNTTQPFMDLTIVTEAYSTSVESSL